MSLTSRVTRSVAFYPVAITYGAAVLTVAGVTSGMLQAGLGLIILAIIAVLVISLSMRRELTSVHHLVNSQHDAMVERIDQLVKTLQTAGVAVPEDKGGDGGRDSG